MSAAASSSGPGKCGRCSGDLQQGYLIALPLRQHVCEWVPGKPDTPLRSKRKPRPLAAWRCAKCGAVDLHVA